MADLVAGASDGCDGPMSLASVVIAKVPSDIRIAASNGNCDGRIYTITFRVTEADARVNR